MTIERLAETVTLIHGDSRELAGHWPAGAVAFTDPPYGIAHVSNKGATWAGTQIASDQDVSVRDQVLEPFANALAFGTWKTPPIPRAKGALVWNKGPSVGMGDLKFPWKLSFDLIYVRGSIWTGKRDEGVLSGYTMISWESKGRAHPHQKPVPLLVDLLRKLPPGTPVVDPFMGSGSTGVACAQLGLPFVGVELDPHHFATARGRVLEELATGRLFAPPAPPATPLALFGDDLATPTGRKVGRSKGKPR